MRILHAIGTIIIVLVLLLALVGLVLVSAMPSHAQQGQCGPRAGVQAHLADKYGEARQSIGIAANSMLMEVWANRDSGSWTITVTTPQGMTCLVASGQSFEAVDEPAPVPGVPG